jgi:hypothetical protein
MVPSARGPKMIVFECPECGEEMEVASRMGGHRVRCVECKRTVTVPGGRSDAGLSTQEWWLFGILFAFIPAANVLVSSVLYYVWRKNHPRRANQINTLGFIVFGCHVLIGIGVRVLFPQLFRG